MTDPTATSAQLNQEAAHDTGLYDPHVHDNQVVALYDTDAHAQAARDALVNSGVPPHAIQLASQASSGSHPQAASQEGEGGIWAAIRSLFVPDEDRAAYSHAVGRGHAVLLVTPEPGMDRQQMVRVLQGTGPVDFDAKLEQWRQAGYDAATPHPDYPSDASIRTGQRDSAPGDHVRSYVAPRAGTGLSGMGDVPERAVTSRTAAGEPGAAADQAATEGAGTSGANAPRR